MVSAIDAYARTMQSKPCRQIGAAMTRHDAKDVTGSERQSKDYCISRGRGVTFWVEAGCTGWNLSAR